ncbi:MAG TPA: glycoside hydrolase family 16 protein [Propionibacteriaceae bacterium]|jgi:beta-glucanase (GH16 family)|nr:glycoside hydrolase family 16 protein [Propionibacteriaceae bacterium]
MSRLTSRRLVVIASVLLTIGALLVAYTVVARLGARTAAPSHVLLDASFDDGVLDPAVFNTCHWWAEDGCTIASNDELEWYLPEQVSVADGALRLTADRDPVRGSDGNPYDYRSGMVTTGPAPESEDDVQAKLAFTYGTVEARLRVPAGQGLWSAMWLLPANRESRPEIDVLEVIGQDPDEVIMHLHPKSRRAESPSQRYRVPGPDLAADWHDVRLDWAPRRLEFFVDGAPVWKVTGSKVPDEPMYLVLNLAVGGAYPGPPDESTDFPATLAIDHLRVTAARE